MLFISPTRALLTMRPFFCSARLLAAGIFLIATAATGQELASDQALGVRERNRPEYEARGLTLGPIQVKPSLSLGFGRDTNLYATETNEVEDRFETYEANLDFTAPRARIPVSLSLGGSSVAFRENPDEDYEDWAANFSLSNGADRRTNVQFDAEAAESYLARSERSFPADAAQRPRLITEGASLEISRLLTSGRVGYLHEVRQLDFDDASTGTGAEIDQDFRDRTFTRSEFRAEVPLTQTKAILIRLIKSTQEYESGTDFARDSTTYSVLLGSAFSISNLMSGEFGIGSLKLDNLDPGQSDRRSLAFSASFALYATPLVTLTLDLERATTAADLAFAASYINSNVAFGVDYELRRNLILSLSHFQTKREISVFDEEDKSNGMAVSGTWLLNRRLSIDWEWQQFDYERANAENFGSDVTSISFNLKL